MKMNDVCAGAFTTQSIPVVAFLVPGKPAGKGRARSVRRGKHIAHITPEETASYESKVALAASQAMAGRPPMAGPMDVVIRMVLPIPESWSKRKQADALAGRLLPAVRPDKDNVIKAIFDGMNNIVWKDDIQVVDLLSRKRYGERPCVQVIVSQVEV